MRETAKGIRADLKSLKQRLIVGDTVFAAETSPVIPLSVMCVCLYLEGAEGGDWEPLQNFGDTVFLTREEAEASLKDREVIS